MTYDLACERVTGLTTDYLERVLPPSVQTTFEQHLIVCSDCLAQVEQIRVAVALLRSLLRRPDDAGGSGIPSSAA